MPLPVPDDYTLGLGVSTPTHSQDHEALRAGVNRADAYIASPLFTRIDDYTVGDGSADDTLGLLEAISLGKHLQFSRGKVHKVSRPLSLQAGQHVYGNGAKLKRAAQVHTTTTTDIVSGVTTAITVATVVGLSAGQFIIVVPEGGQVPGGQGVDYSSAYAIATIVGNLVTIDGHFDVNGSGTTDVYTVHDVIKLAPDVRVYDLELDGNKDNYSFARWENTVEIQCNVSPSADRSIVEGCYLHDIPGEGIIAMGNSTIVKNCTLIDLNGNGIHMSAGTGIQILNNRVENANLTDLVVGHQGACVMNSWTGLDCIIKGNTLINGYWGISLAAPDQLIQGNTIRDCREAGIWCGLGLGDFPMARVAIQDNLIVDSVQVFIGQIGGDAGEYPTQILFDGNILSGTSIAFSRIRDCTITNNTIDLTGETTSVGIAVNYSVGFEISGNTVLGGGYGVYFTGLSGAVIEGNICRGQFTQGIVDEGVTSGELTDNHIENDSGADDTYIGVLVNFGAAARGNTVIMVKGDYGILAMDNSIVKNNHVLNDDGYSIYTYPNSTGITVIGNTVTTPVVNGGGDNNTFRDNGEPYYNPEDQDNELAASMAVTLLGMGWNPSQLDKLGFWLDPTDVVSGAEPSDNDPVGTWQDLSGNGYDFTEATNKPTYKTNIQNGLPMVRFDGTNDNLQSSIPIVYGSPAVTIFCVVAWRSAVYVDSKNIYYDEYGGYYLQTRFGTVLKFGGVGSVGTAQWAQTNGLGVDTAMVLTHVQDRTLGAGLEAHGWYNGIDLGNADFSSDNASTNLTTSVLYLGNAQGASFAQVDFGDIIMVKKNCNAFERALVGEYMRNKWAT